MLTEIEHGILVEIARRGGYSSIKETEETESIFKSLATRGYIHLSDGARLGMSTGKIVATVTEAGAFVLCALEKIESPKGEVE